jgi:hypothetical protein
MMTIQTRIDTTMLNTQTPFNAIPRFTIGDIFLGPHWLTFDSAKTYDPLTGNETSSDYSFVWRAREEADRHVQTLDESGRVGLMFSDLNNGTHLVGLHLHNAAKSPETAELHDWAKALSKKLRSYTQFSPADNAVQILFRATDADLFYLREELCVTEKGWSEAQDTTSRKRVDFIAEGLFGFDRNLISLPSSLEIRRISADEILASIAMKGTDPYETFIHKTNAKYAVVHDGNKVRIASKEIDPVTGNKFWKFCSERDFLTLFANQEVHKIDKDGNEKSVGSGGVQWLYHPLRRTYSGGFVFDPTGREYRDRLNLFQGFALEPNTGDWSLLRSHILTILCRDDPTLFKYVLDWIARMFQFPGAQAETAIVMRGNEGTGKGLLMKVLRKIIGHHSLLINQPRHLVGNFNLHLRDCIFLAADEAFYAGDKAHNSVLKSLITEDEIEIEGKGVDAIKAKNRLHLMMASNDKWVVPAGPDSRRYCVLDVSDAKMQDTEYFTAIFKELENGGYEAFYYDLLKRDISKFRPQPVPMTDALVEQRQLTLGTEFKWFMDALAKGYLTTYENDWADWVSTDSLFKSYEAFAKAAHEWRLLSNIDFGKFLREVGGHAFRPRVGNPDVADMPGAARPHGYKFGDLASARAAFEAATKTKIVWTVYEDEPEVAEHEGSSEEQAEPPATDSKVVAFKKVKVAA